MCKVDLVRLVWDSIYLLPHSKSIFFETEEGVETEANKLEWTEYQVFNDTISRTDFSQH